MTLLPDRAAVGALVAQLVGADVVHIERRPTGRVLVPAEMLAQLWARAPPELRAAMARNLPEARGDPQPRGPRSSISWPAATARRVAGWAARGWMRGPLPGRLIMMTAGAVLAGLALVATRDPGAGYLLGAAAVIPVPGGRGDPTERRGAVIAGSERGLVVVTDPDVVANAVAQAVRLRDQGRTSPADRARLAPSGLWDAVGLSPYLADGDVPLHVPGLGAVRTLYILAAARRAVIVPHTAFEAEIGGLDTCTMTVFEQELVRGLFGGNPDAGRRPVVADLDLPEARAGDADPPALPVLEHVATLGRKYGRATAVLVGLRDTGSGRLVAHPRGGADVDRSLDTAAAYRVLGVPAQRSWAALVGEVVNRDGSPNGALRAGERVEVAHYRGGREVDLDEPDQRAEVARLLVAGQLLGDVDLRAAKVPNLVRDRAGNVGLVDFDGGLELDLGPAEAHFQLVLRGAPFATREGQKVFGVLTEADLLAGYRHVAERGRGGRRDRRPGPAIAGGGPAGLAAPGGGGRAAARLAAPAAGGCPAGRGGGASG